MCISYAVISIFAFYLFSLPKTCSCWQALDFFINKSVEGLSLVAFDYSYELMIVINGFAKFRDLWV